MVTGGTYQFSLVSRDTQVSLTYPIKMSIVCTSWYLKCINTVSWYFLYNNGFAWFGRGFIEKMPSYVFCCSLSWSGVKKYKRPLRAMSTEFLGKIREIQYWNSGSSLLKRILSVKGESPLKSLKWFRKYTSVNLSNNHNDGGPQNRTVYSNQVRSLTMFPLFHRIWQQTLITL